ncbi:MAG: lipid-A-disaccharide synthase N-terminal domain-containing protein [Planctomycetota bacterium]|jgi:lipid-A-disaccharide synthase-like uncharacterized protein
MKAYVAPRIKASFLSRRQPLTSFSRLAGAAMLLTYAAFWKHDPVVTLGQTTGGVVYVRNLMLLRKEKARLRAAPSSPDQ